MENPSPSIAPTSSPSAQIREIKSKALLSEEDFVSFLHIGSQELESLSRRRLPAEDEQLGKSLEALANFVSWGATWLSPCQLNGWLTLKHPDLKDATPLSRLSREAERMRTLFLAEMPPDRTPSP